MNAQHPGRPAGVYIPVIVLALLAGVARAGAPPGDPNTDTARGKSQFAVLPALAYTPETRFILGVVGAYIWESEDTLRKSSITADFLYSQNRQIQTGLSFDIYSDSGRSKIAGEAQYSYWPGKFYGIGNQTPAEVEEPFTEKFFRASLGLFLSVGEGFSAGPEYDFRASSVIQTSDGGALGSGAIAGVANYVASGVGAAAILDTRIDNFSPRGGRLVYLSAHWYSKLLGSDYSFSRYIVDARQYVPFWGGHIIGFQAYFCALSGTVPFQMMSLLGGEVRGRGYYEGRYRDNVLFSGQAEYRT
ncbi:MAG TPA: hypothetical protein VK569_07695, partial [Bacteroidota bacterium]|nr:hypothetical protein [Bacteroidota bacterium]